MSSAGHVLDMINRSKANEAERKYRREKQRKIREAFIEGYRTHGIATHDRTNLTKEELDEIKSNIRNKLKKERIRSSIIQIAGTLVVFAFVCYIAWRIIKR
jgi:hypothetical protein